MRSSVAFALVCLLGGAVHAAKVEPRYARKDSAVKERRLGRSYLASSSLYRRWDTRVVLPGKAQNLSLEVPAGAKVHQWTRGAGWHDISYRIVHRAAPKGHIMLGGGGYAIVDATGTRFFDVAAQTLPDPAPKPVARAKRYDLKGVLFAARPTSKPAAAFDLAVTQLLAGLPARGPRVSRDAARAVATTESMLRELEIDVRRGLLVRVTRSSGGKTTATYTHKDRSRGAFKAARVTVSRPATGQQTLEIETLEWDDQLSLSHRVAWTRGKGTQTLETYTNGRRRVETTSGGVTTGESRSDSEDDFSIRYRVDAQGEARLLAERFYREPDMLPRVKIAQR